MESTSGHARPKAAKAAAAPRNAPAKAAAKKQRTVAEKQAAKKQAARKDAARKQPATKKEAAKKEAAKKQPATKKEAAKKEAAKKEAARKQPATKKEAATKEATARKEPAAKDARAKGSKAPASKAPATLPAAGAKAKAATPAPPTKVADESDNEAASRAATKAAPAAPKPSRRNTVICPLSGFEVKPDKPGLAPRTVERLRVKLLDERQRHLEQAELLAAEAEQLALDRDEGDTQFDEEGGEGDTLSVERERDLVLSASARQIVEEIDRALERIKHRTYGLCVPAGRRISLERLEALPYVETCVDCKARAERRR